MHSHDAYRGFSFIVEIDGKQLASFNSASGLAEVASEPGRSVSREGRSNRKAPGRQEFDVVRLVNGRASSADLHTWYLQATQGKLQRKRGSLIVVDADGQQMMRWNFRSAWPTKWEGPDLSAKSNDVIVDTLELTCEGLERA